MRIIIAGAGAMGCLFAGMLAPAGHRLALIEQNPERVAAIRQRGISIERDGTVGNSTIEAIWENGTAAETADLAIMLVKAYDTDKAMQSCLPAIGPETTVLTVQNGLGNIEVIGKYVSSSRILAGATAQGATLLGHGRVRHAGRGETVIGCLDPRETGRAEAVKEIFNSCGIPTIRTDSVQSVLWGKLLVNAGINALTAVMNMPNREIGGQSDLHEIMARAVREGSALADGLGITLPYADPVTRTEQVCRATGANISSMLQDIRCGRPTEIRSINGALAEYGRRLGIPTPVNSFLTLLVSALESSAAP